MKFDNAAVNKLLRGVEAQDVLLEAGGQVAVEAARLAALALGGSDRGARSIRAEVVKVHGVPEFHVSWTTDFFYYGFAETGTEHQRSTPFLRPAAAKFR